MKIRYDNGRRPPSLNTSDKVYLKLAKGIETGYKLLNNITKLSFQKLGPFPIKAVISDLAYKVALLD